MRVFRAAIVSATVSLLSCAPLRLSESPYEKAHPDARLKPPPAPLGVLNLQAPLSLLCREERDSHDTWAIWSAGLGVASGTSGVGTLAVPGNWKYVTGIGSLLVGVLSAMATAATSTKASNYAEDCGGKQ